MKKSNEKLTRRNLVKGVALMGLSGAIAPLSGFAEAQPGKGGIIANENSKPGTTDWQLTYVRTREYRSEIVEGYCSAPSVGQGENIDIFLSANPATEVKIDIYRIGYYGGKGGRHITTLGPFNTEKQPVPPIGEHRLRECKWKKTTELKIPSDWVSGVYVGKLSCEGHRYQSYIIFVVTDKRKADLLFQTSDSTWVAYNKWPDSYSLYDTDPPVRPWSATTWVSYDRPYGFYPQVVENPLSQGSGEFLLFEYPLCYWLEQNGYDVTYCSNLDTHINKEGLKRAKIFLSVGHDEYWSLEMYDNVKSAVQDGLSVAFLCGNSVYGVVPFNQKNSDGKPYRTVRRTGIFGGFTYETGLSPDEPWEKHGPSEKNLIGARTMKPANGSGDWIVTNDKHWMFEGTGMKNGDMIPGLVGWEHHGDPGDIPGLEVLAAGDSMRGDGLSSKYASTIYPGLRKNWVFNSATIFWSMGLSQPPGFTMPFCHLSHPHGVDERVQKIMSNFLKRCGAVL